MQAIKSVDKTLMKKTGNILILITLLITLLLWVFSKGSLTAVTNNPLISINQLTALIGTILLVWSMFLSTRLDFLEKLFGGLDKAYKVHCNVSKLGMILILIHPLALTVGSLPINVRYFFPVHKVPAINLGVYSFWIFVAAILITLLINKINLSYHVWKQTHRFLNLAMILALLHVVTIQSDTSFFVPLGAWMYMLTGLGVASGLYTTFFYRSFGPKFDYEIESIRRYKDIHDVYLRPLSQRLSHKIAQYAYVSFINDALSKETHPYCITSLPGDDFLRFSIKELGDYTKKLTKLRVGDKAIVYGPYGRLGERFDEKKIRFSWRWNWCCTVYKYVQKRQSKKTRQSYHPILLH